MPYLGRVAIGLGVGSAILLLFAMIAPVLPDHWLKAIIDAVGFDFDAFFSRDSKLGWLFYIVLVLLIFFHPIKLLIHFLLYHG